jgi:hypothetical protein
MKSEKKSREISKNSKHPNKVYKNIYINFIKWKSNGLSFDVTVNRLIERNTDC